MRSVLAVVMIAVLMLPASAFAQAATGDLWRTFAQRIDPGTELTVRLQNGQRFNATLIDARADTLVLQPRTRRPVAAQPVAYEAIASLERAEHRGANVAKVAGIAAGVGGATFLAILAILAASLD